MLTPLLLAESIFAVDIASFVVAVIIGQLISYKLLTHRKACLYAKLGGTGIPDCFSGYLHSFHFHAASSTNIPRPHQWRIRNRLSL